MKLVVDVPDQVRRRGLSSSPWKGGVVVVGCCAQLSDFDSFPTFRFVSAGSTQKRMNERTLREKMSIVSVSISNRGDLRIQIITTIDIE